MTTANKPIQLDMFPVIPEINGLGVTQFKLNGATVTATVEGVTNTNDIALLDNPCWQKAIAEWLLLLHAGDVDLTLISVKKAYVDFINKQGETHRPTPDSFTDDFNHAVNEAVRQAKDEKVVEVIPLVTGKKGNNKGGLPHLPN